MYSNQYACEVNKSTTYPGGSCMHNPLEPQGVSAPSSGSMEFPFFGNTNFPNCLGEHSPFGLPPSQRLPSDPVDKIAVGPHDSSISLVRVNIFPSCNTYIPHHRHRVVTISDAHSGERLLAHGQNTPQSVRRWVRLPNGQAAILPVGPTGYGQVLLPNGGTAPLQVGPTSYLYGHSGDQSIPCTSLLCPSLITANQNHNGGQAFSSVSEGQENTQLNSTDFQLPNQAVLEQNSRPLEGSPWTVNGVRHSRNMTEHEIIKVRQVLVQLRHASNCLFLSGECKDPCCKHAKLLLKHIRICDNKHCRCIRVKYWSYHFSICRGRCSICKSVYAASLKSNGRSVENARIITKRTLSALYANNSEVLNPSSKCCKMDDTVQLGQLTRRFVSNGTEPMVVDKEACIAPPKETVDKLIGNFGPVVSVEKVSGVHPTILQRISVQHGHQSGVHPTILQRISVQHGHQGAKSHGHQGAKSCSNITVPLASQMYRDASLSSPFSPEQVMGMNLRQKRGIDQREGKTQRILLPNTDAVEDLKLSHKRCETDDPNQKCQVTSTLLDTSTELIVLDDDNYGELTEGISDKNGESVATGTEAIKEGAGVKPLVEGKFSVQYEQDVGKKLLSRTTLSSDADVANDTSFLYPDNPDQVMKNSSRVNHHGDKREGNEMDVEFATQRILLPNTETIEDLKPSPKLHETDDPNHECQVRSTLFNTATELIVLDEENYRDLPEEISEKDRESVDSRVVAIKEGAGIEPVVEGKISSQNEQEVVKKLLSRTTLSSVAHVSNDTSFLYHDTPDQVMKNNSRLDHCSDQSKVKEHINQGLEGSMDGNLGKLYCMDKISTETASKEKFIEENTSVQCEQQVESQVHTKADMFEVVADSDISMPSAAHLNQTMLRVNGASLVYSFTSEQVREHILCLKPSSDQAKVTKNARRGLDGSVDYCCSLCGLGELYFEIPPMICSKCKGPIMKNRDYYFKRNVDSTEEGGSAIYYCKKCQKKHAAWEDQKNRYRQKDLIQELEKVKNSGSSEPWVQCDKCEDWQHQICALFNHEKNKGDQTEYTCPKCYLSEIGSVDHKILVHGEILEAKHLPKTKLSDHIEQWLSRRLEEDRQKRADKLGKNINEVPGAEDLVVREVSSMNKNVKVMDSFHEMLLKDSYPKEFPYKSKAILLFQKIGGADVCLFAVYAQEYGFECPYPNRGRVYLSYIDSANYFIPTIQTANEEPLRTYVYHEILIGYLDYCKKRGFSSCHLWVYPSRKKVDYILYSHPKGQKMPTHDKLRKWYQTLIHKAEEENVVVGSTTLYDKYFVPNGGERETNVVAEQLPYFDGDFWPTKVEEILQKNENTTKKKAKELASNSKMEELRGAFTDSRKNDFMIIQLQHDYEHYKEFQLHKKCHETTETNNDMAGIDEDLAIALDEDEKISSKILNTRTAFLEFCQKNNYQFDTLRRAKHSTMMILHNLHNNASEDT